MRRLLIACLLLGCRSTPDGDADEPIAARVELERGIALVQGGELAAGIDHLCAALAAAPHDPALVVQARSWIGNALARSRDPEGSLRECQLALELAPDDPWLHYACGVAWYSMGELECARESFTRGIERDPRHIKSLQWRAMVLRDLDDDRAAIEDLTRALACIESADESALASWNGDRQKLLLKTLDLRIHALEDLGRYDESARDRARYEELLAGAEATSTSAEATSTSAEPTSSSHEP